MKNEAPKCPAKSRRRFIEVATLGAGAALLAAATPRGARAAGKTEALLLSCMDYRLMDDVERCMAGRGLRDQYDHVILAGASLGAITDRYPAWNKTFWEHLDIAIQLHAIRRVIVLDHRDCGAYKVIVGPEHAKDAAREREAHAGPLRKLKAMVLERHPKLEVETLLMSLDGTVEAVA